ncbi:MAG TPA: hypothetical protein VMH04_20765 [Candidatus Solibacter sp.]|nr:hypothetical protein [Candidatus Solibacter sp.]
MKAIRFSAWLVILVLCCWGKGNAQTGLANCSYADISNNGTGTINSCPWVPTWPLYAFTYQNVYNLTLFCENLAGTIYFSQPLTVTAQGVCVPPLNCAPYVVFGPGPSADSVPGTNYAEYDVLPFNIFGLNIKGVGVSACLPGAESDTLVGCPAQSCQDCNSSSIEADDPLKNKKEHAKAVKG